MNSSTRKQRILSHWLIELVLERWFATSCNEERKKDPSRWLKWTQLEFYICISHLVHIINMKNCGFIIVSCPFQLILIAIPVRSVVCTLFFLDMIGTANTKKTCVKLCGAALECAHLNFRYDSRFSYALLEPSESFTYM